MRGSFSVFVALCCLAGGMALPAQAPQGTLSPKLTQTSKIYDGMVSEYWTYAPAGYDPAVPAALMVFQDGGGYIHRDGDHDVLDVIDRLVAEKKIPMMIAVFINPGSIDGSPGTPTYQFVETYGKKWNRSLGDSMRSTEYDTVSDRYARFLRDELLPEVGKHYKLRADAYSRAITDCLQVGSARSTQRGGCRMSFPG